MRGVFSGSAQPSLWSSLADPEKSGKNSWDVVLFMSFVTFMVTAVAALTIPHIAPAAIPMGFPNFWKNKIPGFEPLENRENRDSKTPLEELKNQTFRILTFLQMYGQTAQRSNAEHRWF